MLPNAANANAQKDVLRTSNNLCFTLRVKPAHQCRLFYLKYTGRIFNYNGLSELPRICYLCGRVSIFQTSIRQAANVSGSLRSQAVVPVLLSLPVQEKH